MTAIEAIFTKERADAQKRLRQQDVSKIFILLLLLFKFVYYPNNFTSTVFILYFPFSSVPNSISDLSNFVAFWLKSCVK